MGKVMSGRDSLLERIQKLHQLYHKGQIPTLAEHEVRPDNPPGSRENYLYFTLPPCLNFQRSSPAMWQSALRTWNDPGTNYLFFPERVVATPLEKLKVDLTKHKLGLQPNRHTAIWLAISKTLAEGYEADPRVFLKSCDYDADIILATLRQEKKKDFPYLSGPKMANYWLYILSQYTDIKLTNMIAISIIPDTHVLQCTHKLGLSDKIVTPLEAEKLWKEILMGSRLSPVEMHPVLWNWSRNNFLPEV